MNLSTFEPLNLEPLNLYIYNILRMYCKLIRSDLFGHDQKGFR